MNCIRGAVCNTSDKSVHCNKFQLLKKDTKSKLQALEACQENKECAFSEHALSKKGDETLYRYVKQQRKTKQRLKINTIDGVDRKGC